MPRRPSPLQPREIEERLKAIQRASPGWQPGQNLMLLEIDGETLKELARDCNRWLQGDLKGHTHRARWAWGAALFLVCAKGFGQSDSAVGSYDALWDHLDLPRASLTNHYDNMEEGIRRWWAVPLLRQNGERAFQATMFLHSGGTWRIMEALGPLIPRRWSWEGVAQADERDLHTWLADLSDAHPLSARLKGILKVEEGRSACVYHLQSLAAARQRILEEALCQPDGQPDPGALSKVGISLALLLDAPDEAAAQSFLPILVPSSADQEDRQEGPEWDWSLGEHAPHLGIRLPKRLQLTGLPADSDRVQILVAGKEAQGKPPVYRRVGSDFEHMPTTPRHLAPLIPPSGEIALLLRYRSIDGVEERMWRSISLPGEPVSLFNQSTGDPLDTLKEGDSVALVAVPGYELPDVQGMSRGAVQGCAALFGCFPAGHRTLTLQTPAGPEEWEIPHRAHSLPARVTTQPVPNLWFKGARAYREWPVLWLGSGPRRGELTLEGPGEPQVRPFLTHTGRVSLPRGDGPGLYTLRLTSGERQRSLRFAYLPRMSLRQARSAEGTQLTISLPDLPPPRLRQVGGVLSGAGALTIPAEHRGALTLSVAIGGDCGLGDGRLKVVAGAPTAEVLESEGGAVAPLPLDMGLLAGAGGIAIQGLPSESVTLDFGDELTWTVVLSPEGERFFSFFQLPPRLLRTKRANFTISLGWRDGRQRIQLGPFHNEAAERPKAIEGLHPPDHLNVGIHLSRAPRGSVYLEALPANDPSKSSQRHLAQRLNPAEEDVGIYGARLSLTDAPLIACLTDGTRRLTGMRLFHQVGPRVDRKRLIREMTGVIRTLPRTAAGLNSLERLCVPMVRFGPQWFFWGDGVARGAGALRLLALLKHIDDPDGSPLLNLMSAADTPWSPITYEDIASLRDEIAASGVEELRRWMERVAEQEVGLFLPCYELLRKVGRLDVQDEGIGRLLAPWAAANAAQPLLEPHELDLIQTFNRDDLQRAPAPRVQGLLEARYLETSPRWKAKLRELHGFYHHPADLSRLRERRRIPLVQNSIPTMTQQIEETVISMAYRLHRWRGGATPLSEDGPDGRAHSTSLMTKTFSGHLQELEEHLPALLDHWLNTFAAQRILKTDKRETGLQWGHQA